MRRAAQGLAAALLAAAVAVAVPPAPASPAQAPPPQDFFGLQAWTVPTASDVAMMARGGVGSLRAVFDGAIEAQAAGVRWARYDALMAAAARARIEVLPVLLGIPGGSGRVARPRTRAQRATWARFVSEVAGRYGRGGTFWAAHPDLVPMPLTAYQVWNEPNLAAYWRPDNDAAGYLRLVALTRARLLAVDPNALIVLAGLPDSRIGTPMVDYVRAIYAQPGAQALFDVVAVHPYAVDAPGVIAHLDGVRAVMDQHADATKPIWITELGWATAGPPTPFTTTPYGQAGRVTRTLRALLAARERLGLGRVVWFGLQDRPYGAGEAPWWGPNVGLFDVAGRPKPGWHAFVDFTGGRPGGRLPRVGRAPRPPSARRVAARRRGAPAPRRPYGRAQAAPL